MQNFAGLSTKFIAGIAFTLLISIPHAAFSDDSAAAPQPVPVAVGSGASSSEKSAAQTAPVTVMPPLLSAKPVPAQTSQSTAAQTNSASQLAALIGGLALILVLIYGLSWFVKRFSQGGFLNNPTMKIVTAMPLGTRERLMLIDVGGKQLLLGVTATQINTLHVFDDPVVQTGSNQPATSDFSQKLMSILQQKNVVPAADAPQKK